MLAECQPIPPNYPEIARRHVNRIVSIEDSINRHVVAHLDSTHHLRLMSYLDLATVIRRISEDEEKSVKILQDALHAIKGLSRAFIQDLPNEWRKAGVNSILARLKSWNAPFDLPSGVIEDPEVSPETLKQQA
jgi:hypothetical protein